MECESQNNDNFYMGRYHTVCDLQIPITVHKTACLKCYIYKETILCTMLRKSHLRFLLSLLIVIESTSETGRVILELTADNQYFYQNSSTPKGDNYRIFKTLKSASNMVLLLVLTIKLLFLPWRVRNLSQSNLKLQWLNLSQHDLRCK